MIITKFLVEGDYHLYGDWLRSQDTETREMYFGVADGRGIVDSLLDSIECSPQNHKFLVAYRQNDWAGVMHIAEVSATEIEFGIIVSPDQRGQGTANLLMEEALAWARNRGYQELFMHCLTRNQAIKHLCNKHGLTSRNMFGETAEIQMHLDPPSMVSLAREISIKHRNLFHTVLQNNQNLYKEIYG
jgi:GNAT superfamily N-acetyltransferase